jgi:hypothetical protein
MRFSAYRSLAAPTKFTFPSGQHVLDASVRYKPNERDDNVEAKRDPLRQERQGNGDGVRDRRQLAFPISADSAL